MDTFPKTKRYLGLLSEIECADHLDRVANELINDINKYEKASQALRRRFVRGATEVDAIDRGARLTKIKRQKIGGKFHYYVQGADGNWVEPDERIWVVAMYALWQRK